MRTVIFFKKTFINDLTEGNMLNEENKTQNNMKLVASDNTIPL